MKDFLIPFLTVFMGEMGDKTQLVTLTFAARYNWRVVMAGILCGTLLLDFISVCLGNIFIRFVDRNYLTLAAGIAFIAFSLWSFREEKDEEENTEKTKNPFLAVFITFFFAEIGDKTMLSTIAVATQYTWYKVWIGATLGMVIADGLAVYIGMKLGKLIPEKRLKIIASVLFFLFGVYYLYNGIRGIV